VVIAPLPSIGCPLLLSRASAGRHLPICCLAMSIHVTLLPPSGYSSRIAYRHTAISSFPRAVFATSVSPSRCSFFLLGVYSPTATTAPSIMLPFPSNSLISCEPVHVYYHYPRPRILDPVCQVIYPGEFVWSFPRGLKFGRFSLRAGWAIESHSVAVVVTCKIGYFIVQILYPITGQF
jgi:hypothetical protein